MLLYVFNTNPLCSPSRTHTVQLPRAPLPPRASELTLPSCSTDLGSLLGLLSVPQSKPEKRNSQ